MEINPYNVLQETHNKILQRCQQKKGNARKIANILNQSLYPKKNNAYAVQQYQNRINNFINSYEKELIGVAGESLDEIQLIYGDFDVKTTLDNMNFLIDRNEYDNLQAFKTLFSRITQCEPKIKKLMESFLSGGGDLTIFNESNPFQELEQILKKIVKDFFSQEKRKVNKSDTKSSNVLSSLELYFMNLIKNQEFNIVQKYEIVKNFIENNENILIKKIAHKVTGDLFENLILSVCCDKIKEGTGAVIGSVKTLLEEESPEKISQKYNYHYDSRKKITTFKLKDGSEIKINDTSFKPFESRDGKTDVIIQSQSDDFQISAKNWSSWIATSYGLKKYQSFDTNFIYAMIRSLGIDNTFAWKQGINNSEKKPQLLNQYHNLGKYIIVADAIMGYSQVKNYADTLVIHNSSDKTIYVASIADLMTNIFNKIQNLEIKDYKDNIKNNKGIFSLKNEDFLKQMKIQIHISIKEIQNYIQFYGHGGREERIVIS